jgi:hypothetical protein
VALPLFPLLHRELVSEIKSEPSYEAAPKALGKQGGDLTDRGAFQLPLGWQNIQSSYTEAAKQAGESRNALVRQAVSEWLKRHSQPQWPDEVLSFTGAADMPSSEASRDSLKQPASDPLA